VGGFSPGMQPWNTSPQNTRRSISANRSGRRAAWLRWLTTSCPRRDLAVQSHHHDRAGREAEAPTLDWLLGRFETAALRDGVTDVLIDLWNEIIQRRGEMGETVPRTCEAGASEE
jgi:hypothetical protein